MQLTGAAAIVTGGASGLGLATVRTLHAAGARVVIADLPSSAGKAIVDELGDGVAFVPTDVTDPDQAQAAVDRAASLGPVRVLVNCAGIGTPGRTIGKEGPLPLDQFSRIVIVNLIGTFNMIRLAAAAMIATDEVDGERGVIVSTSSVAAFDGQVGQAAYSASKGGIVGMTLPIARDLANQKVRAVTIAPGLFRTPMFATLSYEFIASLEAQVPHPSRLGDPSEYAAMVAHIIANPMLNGETIRLDGAIRMAPR